jgi:pimeloyl-ACP methyl ester carboxylesterase
MLLFLPGTGGHGRGPTALLETAASLGYRCVTLMYPDDVAAAEVCRQDFDPESFEDFRMAIIRGGKSTHIRVEEFDSIESRLTKLLLLLRQARPLEDWGQFLDAKDGIRWEKIAVAGQSQGGGHAGLIAVKHRVARVLMFGAPKDFSLALQRPANWYSEAKATPVSRFFAINHRQDRQGCSFDELLENVRALGMEVNAPVVDIDREEPPYRNSRVLVTDYPGTRVDSKTAHGTAIANGNQAVFRKTWIYMLTTPTGPG